MSECHKCQDSGRLVQWGGSVIPCPNCQPLTLDMPNSDWRKWLEDVTGDLEFATQARKDTGNATSAAMWAEHYGTRLLEGYRLLAEAVEAKADLDAAVDEYVKARQSPLQIDPERTNALGQRGLEMQTRYHQAQAKALAHLRGVGID